MTSDCFNSTLLPSVKKIVGDRVANNVQGKTLTTFSIGGPCRAVVTVDNEQELQALLQFLHGEQQSVVTLGFGSNVLIPDGGVHGWVIRLGGNFRRSRKVCSDTFCFGAGASLMRESRTMSKEGFSGLEFAAGIPGSFGGGVYMNAGAHGSEISERVSFVRGFFKDGKYCELRGDDLTWNYRCSGLPSSFIVTEVVMSLMHGDRDRINANCLNNLAHRKATQPLSMPSAGSVFKNPSPTLSAGRVLEEVGMKGVAIGDVSISDLHANWIVNPSKRGTARHVQELITYCRNQAEQLAGVILEPEIRLWEHDSTNHEPAV
jgi:UDP-N-acetylmuramate dehydrogenase